MTVSEYHTTQYPALTIGLPLESGCVTYLVSQSKTVAEDITVFSLSLGLPFSNFESQ